MPFIPHTEADIAGMLATVGVAGVDELFDEIPAALRCSGLEGVPEALSEAGIYRLMQARARADGEPLCFLGAGAYDHYVPAAVWDIATRGEFYSAYTPYQAEASQGTLQVIYEFQTMLASLTGLDVANASLYDGATAFAEACLMAVRANRKTRSRRVLVPRTLSPVYKTVVRSIVGGQGIELVELPMLDGVTDIGALQQLADTTCAAVAIQHPSFLGTLEDVDTLVDWAHAQGALVIGVVNPMALAILRPPGEWGATGADIACGEGQPMGVPLSSGGPYFGFLTCRQDIVRQMPGRIVGRTVDLDGTPGFTLTLQAREQHIRRSRATSNICTNQGLVATAATIYMALMGAAGLREVAGSCNANLHALVDALCALPGIRRAFAAPCFHESVLLLDRPVAPVLDALSRHGVLGGYDLSGDYPELGNALLVCATETRTAEDIALYAGLAGKLFEAAA
ncbi:MAG: aminomethyl-transferring glycine dehydrogenase subunit GcvPA [Gammaproteobacteria bacterium]|nr:aminomethyl-transferring glycine dehydrogenase subunit GcvPA [Gammaproteobacteria bacterium]